MLCIDLFRYIQKSGHVSSALLLEKDFDKFKQPAKDIAKEMADIIFVGATELDKADFIQNTTHKSTEWILKPAEIYKNLMNKVDLLYNLNFVR